MHILFLSRWQPFPPNNGSKLRIYNLLKIICQVHQITLLSFREPADQNPDPGSYFDNLVDVQTILYKPFEPANWRSRLGFFSLRPRMVIDTYSSEMETAIRKVLQTSKIDLVIASQFDMAMYRPLFQHLPALYEEIEIGIFNQRVQDSNSLKQRFRNQLTWLKHRHYLGQLLSSYQSATVVSEHEAALVRRSYPQSNSINIIPNSVDLAEYDSFHTIPVPQQMIFTGSFRYEPNYQAMSWFVDQVFPAVLSTFPDVQLIITGDPAGKDFSVIPNVTQTGMVDDIRPWVARSWLSLAPIHSGGGTRLKILEAMGLKSAVVSTSKGAEGLDLQAGEHLLVGDNPQEFASAVCCLLGDPNLRVQLVAKAYQRVAEKYDWAQQAPKILNILDQITTNKREVGL